MEYKLILPPMGEGIIEATVTEWMFNEGDYINEDDIVVGVATDKVDSDLPSPIAGKLIRKLKDVDEICKIGEAIAILELEDIKANSDENNINEEITEIQSEEQNSEVISELQKPLDITNTPSFSKIEDNNFYSPLVRSICKEENISEEELLTIQGSGLQGRITKEDIFKYLEYRKNKPEVEEIKVEQEEITNNNTEETKKIEITEEVEQLISNDEESVLEEIVLEDNEAEIILSDGDEIIEMDRMRKLIASNMMKSLKTSAHVTSFQDADVSDIVKWRKENKDLFFAKNGEKITFMPIFIKAIVDALKKYPLMNVSIEGYKIIKKKNINIGMAAALPNGNLIVPVIKNANDMSLAELAKTVNDLANRARNNQLKPEDTQGGTYTVTNIGNFNNITGTPIINQPQVAVMAIGAIIKKPTVIETESGDFIGIRSKTCLAHTYDHRIIDGALGGMFLNQVCKNLELFFDNE